MHLRLLVPALLTALAGFFFSSFGETLCAAQNYAAPKYIRWDAKKGNWKDGKNWNGGKVPSGFCIAGCRMACTVTLNSPVPEVYSAGFGGPGAGAFLYIEDGAKLKLQSSLSIFAHENGYRGTAEMSGGEIELGLNGDYACLGIGNSSTFSAQGVMTISGGIIRGAIVVGSPEGTTGNGELFIQGSKARIMDNGKRASLGIWSTGKLTFILDEKGVSVLDYSERTVRFDKGARLEVDASDYRGSSKRIPLILATRFQGIEDLEMAVKEQPRDAKARIVVEKPPSKAVGIYLEIKK